MMRTSLYSSMRGLVMVAMLSWLSVGGMAQDAQPKSSAAGCAMCQPMMPGGEIAKLSDRVAASSAALEKETDPTVLKKKLAEHAKLTKSLQAKIKEHGDMMKKMMGDEGGTCPMMNMGGMGNMSNMPKVTPVNPDPDMSSMPGHHHM